MKRIFIHKLYLLYLAVVIINLFISCDKEVYQSPVEPKPFEGNLKISSNPQGFSIFLNQRNSGSITPDSLPFLDPGIYTVTLKKYLFRDSSFSINFAEDEKISLSIDFTQNLSMYGKLNILSSPAGATIKINDSLIQNVTPYTFQKLLPGEYDISLGYPEHRSSYINAIVSSSNTSYYSKSLADTSEWVDYQVSNSGLVSNNLSCIAIDNNNNKWIGTLDKGLVKFDETNFYNFNATNSGIPSNRILTISVDSQNKIWVGTSDGLAVFDGNTWLVYNKTNSGLRSNEILSVKFDNNGIVWIGAYTGLYKFDGSNWTRYNDAANTIWVNDLELDNGNVWIATTSGIVKLVNNSLEYFYDSVYNYPTKNISSVSKDILGNIWFCHLNSGSIRNGISYFNGNIFQNFHLGTNSNAMNFISIDGNNNKWICSNEGLFKLSTSNVQTVFNKSNSLISSDRLSCAAIDISGNIWITSYYNGLIKFKFSN